MLFIRHRLKVSKVRRFAAAAVVLQSGRSRTSLKTGNVIVSVRFEEPEVNLRSILGQRAKAQSSGLRVLEK